MNRQQARHSLRWLALAGAAGAVALLGGCVVAPPAYGPYGEAAYVQPGAPVVIAPPISLGIGIGGSYGGGRGYYGRPGYYGRGNYGGRGSYGGRGYWR